MQNHHTTNIDIIQPVTSAVNSAYTQKNQKLDMSSIYVLLIAVFISSNNKIRCTLPQDLHQNLFTPRWYCALSDLINWYTMRKSKFIIFRCEQLSESHRNGKKYFYYFKSRKMMELKLHTRREFQLVCRRTQIYFLKQKLK